MPHLSTSSAQVAQAPTLNGSDELPSPKSVELDLRRWRRVLWDVSLEIRGFVVTAEIVMHDMLEPLPAEDNLARMRLGVVDIRVYRRLKRESVRAGFLYVMADGRVSSTSFDAYLDAYVSEFMARRKASLEREARLRSERGEPAKRAPVTGATREEVLRKTGGKCVYCGVVLTIVGGLPNSYCADHVLPVVRGGETDIGNLVPSCAGCNAKKSAKTALSFMNGGGSP